MAYSGTLPLIVIYREEQVVEVDIPVAIKVAVGPGRSVAGSVGTHPPVIIDDSNSTVSGHRR